MLNINKIYGFVRMTNYSERVWLEKCNFSVTSLFHPTPAKVAEWTTVWFRKFDFGTIICEKEVYTTFCCSLKIYILGPYSWSKSMWHTKLCADWEPVWKPHVHRHRFCERKEIHTHHSIIKEPKQTRDESNKTDYTYVLNKTLVISINSHLCLIS